MKTPKKNQCLVSKGGLFPVFFLLLLILPFASTVNAQEENPYLNYDVPFQNLLKFNRFLINPTFSTVREDKSYVNFFHRSQSAYYENNSQNYFLSYSGRINDRTGLGLSLYNQTEGVVTNIGVLANYAYGVRLGPKTVFSFGVNIPYYRSNVDQSKIVTGEEDPFLDGLNESSILAFQPGLNLAMGKFDIGIFAENLADFNLKTGKSLTEFSEKTFSGHLQYTHGLSSRDGVFENGRLLPLARVRSRGQESIEYGGGIILDLPKIGWLQGGYDSFYGISAGTGFNLSRRLSLGYNFEKGLSNGYENFGVTHELSVALSFIPNLTEDMVNLDEDSYESLVVNETADDKYDRPLVKDLDNLNYGKGENYALLQQLQFRLDSLEKNRERDLERRFEMVMRIVKRETNGARPDLEETAKKVYFVNNDKPVADDTELAQHKVTDPNKDDLTVVSNTIEEYNSTVYERPEYNDPQDIITRKFGKIPGIDQGHYIVANVFGNKAYMENFIKELRAEGLNVNHFRNPENGLNYVYLAHYEDSQTARDAYVTKLNGKYGKEMWIMDIDDSRYSGMATLEFSEE
ncbi:PorP/SprF family type IX secretion system membrane protein [Sediminicola sp. 1XM1-17]|uniref:PorP/SprF family type IX secretion system membrane protein n=1 Tax=Sediminicola sp. 1XM1-17 TaxID=3127702 RepID=UPI00307784AA